MSILGRHLFYDYPAYYNLFSRLEADAGVATVRHTNRQLLGSYSGADGIKTGYTRAAGFNLTASAERGGERIIATVFGGNSTASRNAKVAELLDLGFRKAPSRVAVVAPARPPYMGKIGTTPVMIAAGGERPELAGKTVRLTAAAAVRKSLRPQARPVAAPPVALAAAEIERAVVELAEAAAEAAPPVSLRPEPRPEPETVTEVAQIAAEALPEPGPEIVTRLSSSDGRHWGVNVGRYPSQYKARQVLLQTALSEMSTLDGSLRKVVKRPSGFDANFMGMSRESADLACRRLQAKKITCFMIGPG
jgi:D-alanyl-D-alanine carboxypeptidase